MGSRREFFKRAGALAAAGTSIGALSRALRTSNRPAVTAVPRIVRPPRLRTGDTVGLVAPAGAVYDPMDIHIMEEYVEALGLTSVRGQHVLARHGYFAGTDEQRADDLNRMFANPDVDAIFALHGGWGAARILPMLDYELVAANPKILLGYSDITSLLLALYARSGLVTFHGPNGNSTWNAYSVDHLRRIVFDAEALTLRNPTRRGDNLTQVKHRVRTIRAGTARGPLAGGNLTIISSLVGSGYLPDWSGHILFLEDINEDIYRVDRMLTQLKLGGVLDGLAGFVFGKCSDCDADSGYSSFTLEEVLAQHVEPLGIPAWHGAMIGHIEDKFTVPLGVQAEIDAEAGTIELLEAAVA